VLRFVAEQEQVDMMSPGEKVVAVGAIGFMNAGILALSGILGAGALFVSLPMATAIYHQ